MNSQNETISLKINTTFGTEKITDSTNFISAKNDTIHFTKIKLYLTDFKGITKSEDTLLINNSHFLIDGLKENNLINLKGLKVKSLKAISFKVGVPENLNYLGALSGDLDPVNGMFWSWQSGYINFKIEGISSSCNTRKNKFQLHVGGYKEPYKTTRQITLMVLNKTEEMLTLNIDLKLLFNNISLKEQNQVMIPGEEAYILANKVKTIFSLDE